MQVTTKDQIAPILKHLEHCFILYIMIILKMLRIAFRLIFCFQQRKINYSQFKKNCNIKVFYLSIENNVPEVLLRVYTFSKCVKSIHEKKC